MSALLACIEVIEEELRRRSVEEQLRSLGQWPPPTQGIVAPHVIDPDAVLADQRQRRRLANEQRKRDARLTPEQQDAIAEYARRHSKPSKRQAEKDLGIPRHKIKWPRPMP